MTGLRVERATDTHVPTMAAVLAGVHADAGSGGPCSTLADHEVARAAVGSALTRMSGVVAVEGDGDVVGFLLAPLPPTPGPDTARWGPALHAATTEHARPAYRRLYEEVSGTLVAAGCTEHSMPVLASDPAALETLFELGFGIDQIKGAVPVRESGAAVAAESAAGIRLATAEDVDSVLALAVELSTFHSRPPMFHPALLDVPSIRADILRSIADERSTVLVADAGGRVVAMLQAQPDAVYEASVLIGMNVVTEAARSGGVGTAMVNVLLGWASAQGFRHCTVGWSSANRISDGFYRSRGFTPVRYRLQRRIDRRVSWANESLDYGLFGLAVSDRPVP